MSKGVQHWFALSKTIVEWQGIISSFPGLLLLVPFRNSLIIHFPSNFQLSFLCILLSTTALIVPLSLCRPDFPLTLIPILKTLPETHSYWQPQLLIGSLNLFLATQSKLAAPRFAFLLAALQVLLTTPKSLTSLYQQVHIIIHEYQLLLYEIVWV